MIYDGKKIAAERERKGWSQRRLAKECGLSAPTIWALEHGRTKMVSHEVMLKIAAALGISVAAISVEPLSTTTAERGEMQLIEIYNQLPDPLKTALVSAAVALKKSQE